DLPVHSAALIASGTLGVANGGTGTVATPTNGQLHIGNGSGFNLATLTSGTGINVVNAAGAITINATADASTKVTKAGDTMTGSLNLPANGLVAGTSQLVLSGGNVGIGTTSATHKLEIQGSQATFNGISLSLFNSNGTNTNGWVLGTGGAVIPSDAFSIGDSSSYKMTILSSGNVGIGTTAPAVTMDIRGPWGAPATSGVTQTGAMRIQNSSTFGNVLDFGGYSAAPWGLWLQAADRGGLGTNYPIVLQPNGGNVGIGTSVPAYLLDVVGAGGVRISGSNSAGFMEFIDNTAGGTTSNGLQIRAGSNSSTGAVMAYFIRPDSTAIGSITQNSTTTVAYNTTSDHRIKENITDSASGLDLLARIRVRDYNYIADPANQIRQGFVAQELYEVYPQAVTVGCVERIRKRIHGRSTTASSRRCWLSLCRASRVGTACLKFRTGSSNHPEILTYGARRIMIRKCPTFPYASETMVERSCKLPKNHSFFLFGARGAGKTSLIRSQVKQTPLLWIDLLDRKVEDRYLTDPGLLYQECQAGDRNACRWVTQMNRVAFMRKCWPMLASTQTLW
ncbi:MAG: tail fiber domain-containing protein, partial [Proteobacteria bacterium]|nr:tail fiber domain-containing protein [Pseudomonadota bacterium]